MSVGIVGSRDFVHIELVEEFVAGLPSGTAVVSGGARGVDTAAETTARRSGLTVVSFRPRRFDGQWLVERITYWPDGSQDLHDLPTVYRTFPAAAHVRNGFIVEFADDVYAFWNGRSSGTHDSIRKASDAGKLREVIRGPH